MTADLLSVRGLSVSYGPIGAVRDQQLHGFGIAGARGGHQCRFTVN